MYSFCQLGGPGLGGSQPGPGGNPSASNDRVGEMALDV